MLSEALYVRLARADVAAFRFLLEAREGLALFTSLGQDAQGREVLQLRFASGSGPAVRRFLNAAESELALELLAGSP
jgi:hypothetical protein